MKKIRKILLILTIFCLFNTMQLTTVFAETLSQDGLEIILKTDKTEYTKDEKIAVSIGVENSNYSSTNNLCLENIVPNGYICENGYDVSKKIEKLGMNEGINLVTVYEPKEVDINGLNTGDSSNTVVYSVIRFVYSVICVVLFIALLVFFINGKRKKEILSVFLCAMLIGSLFLNVRSDVFAADNDQIQIVYISTKVFIEDEELTISAKVRYNGDLVDDETLDSDNDGISDYLEEYFGTDKNNADTDGDGLSDYIELFYTETNPLVKDSDNNGISDDLEDYDGDGVCNIDEINYGTNLIKKDTDGDGLSDADEINIYKTDPLKSDTDGDGVSDGWEVEYNYNPLFYNSVFLIEKTFVGENVSVSVSLKTEGKNVASLCITPTEKEWFFDSTIPGYIDSAFDFSVDGTFNEAKIMFEFDELLLSDETFNPCIYYFNEETQILEELETNISENVASTVVNSFSTYILLNKTEFDKIWESDIKSPQYSSNNGLDIVFVIDSSSSMTSNDKNNLRLKAAKNFVDKLDENDRAAIIDFNSDAVLYQSFTNDHKLLYDAINKVGGYGETDLSAGMNIAINQFTNSDYTRTDANKYIIFLTDGDGSYNSSYTKIAYNNGIVIYTIGLGASIKSEVLQSIADITGGKCFFASTADALDNIYSDIASETIDYSKDSNNDGISDYYTKKLCEGKLRIGTGKLSPFLGIDYEDIQNNADYDFDGLLNGQELVVNYNKKYNRVYAWIISDPASDDSDYDGIKDNKEIDGYRLDNKFVADLSYSLDNSYDTTVSFKVDYRYFFQDNTKFNKQLAILASVYSIDMYDKGYITISDGASGTTKNKNGVDFGSIFGMNDGALYTIDDLNDKYAKLDSNGHKVDTDDVSEVYIGHRLVSYKGEQREIIFLIIRGTNSTQAEWSSNLDVGANTSNYYNMTGEHPDWTNKENHKGFDVASNRVLSAFNDYISGLEENDKLCKSAKRSIFITGHSRGAAIANILGTYFEDNSNYDSYVYTMACPYTTTSSNTSTYKTIFNIVNKDDIVPYLPLYEWGFRRYGNTLSISIEENYEDNKPFMYDVGTFEYMFNRDYNSNGRMNNVIEAFLNMVSGENAREDLYVLDTISGDGVVLEGTLHVSDSAYTDQVNLLRDLNMDKYCTIEKIPVLLGSYTIKITYCPAYVMQSIANIASSGDIEETYGYGTMDLIGIDLKGKYREARWQFILGSGEMPLCGDLQVGGMEHPHMPVSYYLICNNTSYTEYSISY